MITTRRVAPTHDPEAMPDLGTTPDLGATPSSAPLEAPDAPSKTSTLDAEMRRWMIGLGTAIFGGLIIVGVLLYSGFGINTTDSSSHTPTSTSAPAANCAPPCTSNGLPGQPAASAATPATATPTPPFGGGSRNPLVDGNGNPLAGVPGAPAARAYTTVPRVPRGAATPEAVIPGPSP